MTFTAGNKDIGAATRSAPISVEKKYGKVRVGAPLFADTLFPTYVAGLIWMGLWLRNGRARAMLAPSSGSGHAA
jgi:hypothetical protein